MGTATPISPSQQIEGEGDHRELTALAGGRNFQVNNNPSEERAMKWRTPVIIEIAVGLEINAYACAEVG
jgi:coenzyme PQQ precursor peptide PqqA